MRLSVVIPTLNEEESLPVALASVAVPGGASEVVVSDGGSTDSTVALAERHGARVVMGAPGRAAQLNRGANAATGDALLFLHADCRLGPDAPREVGEALRNPGVVGGSFRLRVIGAGPTLALIAQASNARARYLGAPYGDQGLFLRRSAFDRVGGFPDVPFMEDVAMVRAIKRLGRLVQLRETIETGTRHWDALGPIATTTLNWTMVALYAAGVPPERLAPAYHRLRDPDPRRSSRAQEFS